MVFGMPSFIAASRACRIITTPAVRDAALASGFSLSGYEALNSAHPIPDEFTKLKNDFKTFCEQIRVANPSIKPNKIINCDMLMFTGFHGDYQPNGRFNNLSLAQLTELIEIAKLYQINFKHIIADCCCAPFGLEKIHQLLANGGEAIGDRMTSQSYVAHDLLFEKLEAILLNRTPTTEDEKILVDEIFGESLRIYNAPIWISKFQSRIEPIGTSDDEVIYSMFDKYAKFGLFDSPHTDLTITQKKSSLMDIFPDEINQLGADLIFSRELFPLMKEIDIREDLIKLRELRQFVFNYLTRGLHFESMQQTRGIGFFRVKHSEGVKIIQDVDAYLTGKSGAFTSEQTQTYIDRVNKHIEKNAKEGNSSSISKSMKKL